jgi:hypothetical protein
MYYVNSNCNVLVDPFNGNYAIDQAKTIEYKRTELGKILEGTEINVYDWVEMWSKALRADYLPSVNVKAVKATLDEKGRKQLDKAICETLKYSVKPSDLALERDKGAWLHEMTKQVHKMRFIATGGVLKGILKPEDEITTEEMISSSEEVQDVGEARVAFQFRPEYRKYVYAPKYNEYAD